MVKWKNKFNRKEKKNCDVSTVERMRIYSLRNNRLGYNTSGILIRVEYKGPCYPTTNYNTQQGFWRHSFQQSLERESLLPYWFPVRAYTNTINGQVIAKMNNFFQTVASEILTANGLSSQKSEKDKRTGTTNSSRRLKY